MEAAGEVMKAKLGTVCMALGLSLIAAALGLLLYNQNEANQAGEASAQLMELLEEQLETVPERPGELEVPREVLTAEELEMTEFVIDGHAYIGYISIPALELELPILSQWDMDKLQIAPCRYYGTLKGNDLVLMAHNYDKHFGRLDKLADGDAVYFKDMDGVVTAYTVTGQDILDPDAVEEMTAGEFDLTLFTCTYGGENRVTVYCDRAK